MSERTIPPQCPHGFPAGSVICTQCYSEMSHQIDHPVEPTCEERLRDEAVMSFIAALIASPCTARDELVVLVRRAMAIADLWLVERRKRKEG